MMVFSFRSFPVFPSLALALFLLLASGLTSTAAAESLKGVVVETMNASDYTYLLLDTGTEEVWAAIPATPVKEGAEVSLAIGMDMKDFHSKTLDRTFSRLIFSPGLEGEQQVTAAPEPAGKDEQNTSSSFADAVKKEQQQATPAQAPAAASGGSAGATVPFVDMQVDKAEGENGYTVGELFDQAADLNGKTVKVRGRVVKVSPSIMGRNWIHLQDGSGDPMANTHDLVVTSQELPEVDDIIEVQGVVAADKDFGFGYEYAVLLEQAAIVK